MSIHPLAGKPAPHEILINIPRLMVDYFANMPDDQNPNHRVAFGTSGHRGTSTLCTFNENHNLAICQAICELRLAERIHGPLFLGMDTHALSEAAHATAVEVFAANHVNLMIDDHLEFTPTPVISHAILGFNRNHKGILADGVILTPSHNPPGDGGVKYNPPSGGPADTRITEWIQNRANELLNQGLREVKRIPYKQAINAETTRRFDYMSPYTADLKNVLDLAEIANAQIRIGVDPMGGASVKYWERIAEQYKLDLQVVNRAIDPSFSFIRLDHDGKIRMDCSSRYAMAGLIEYIDQFDIAFGNDPDVDRHGIVTRSVGLMDPNHYLSVAIWYLFTHRPVWGRHIGVGKTLVSSFMIDRVTTSLDRILYEVPVGFKWFVEGLLMGKYGFAGEESAGASFLRKNGTVWVTEKDGFIMDLLAAEIIAVLGRDPGECYHDLTDKYGETFYARLDAYASREQKDLLKNLSPAQVKAVNLAGSPIIEKLTRASANNAPIGGLKIITDQGWFAARPSGTEDIYKIYAESLVSLDHLRQIQREAQEIVSQSFKEAS